MSLILPAHLQAEPDRPDASLETLSRIIHTYLNEPNKPIHVGYFSMFFTIATTEEEAKTGNTKLNTLSNVDLNKFFPYIKIFFDEIEKRMNK